ncbi:putative Mg2+ and Co2+ transporter CorB [Thioflavicoccus mobilis 8321]|uniref:Putative Mg2+ and Co2+ transporter CorB n=1 Tax=Thioflavicoccus mobilis 8321 TaxID=765912 RepID=L0GXG9_9GAMM|nr:HlyC/CorC family transporter [Thioflavicoccus mobilis]AGA90691.1 putative Mg2+ and Co2+ transporter CorB [Thioflavicoccus mobilis 8321]
MTEPPLSALFFSLLLLLVLSAFFSGSETALMTINRYRLRHLADHGHRGARLAQALLERPDRLIGLVLLGNNFVNILASSLATIIALRIGGDNAIAIAAGLLTMVILIFAEVTPKTLAALDPERIAYPAAYVYTPLIKVFSPLVWSVSIIANNLLRTLGVEPAGPPNQTLSREELRTVVSEAGAMIPERSRDMLLAILDLEGATVEDIMIPRHEVEGIDLQDSDEDIIRTIRNAGYSRLPLFDGGVDNVVGLLHLRHVLSLMREREDFSKEHLREVCYPPYFVPEGTRLYQQLINFQREKQRVALVVDEYGDFLGLITLTDLLEEIVGEFTTDPADRIPEIVHQADGSVLIDCGIAVRDLNRVLRWKLPTQGPKTLNGLILEYLETIPETGTSLKLNGHVLEIIQTGDNAVKTVRHISKITPRKPKNQVS